MKNFVIFLFCILTINYVSHAQTTQRDSIYTLLHKTYDYVECFNDLGLAKVSQVEKYGVIDKTGAVRIPFIYNNIKKINNDNYIVSIANKKGIVNSDNMPILPIIYENILPYTKDKFMVSQNGKYGIVDSKQTILLPLIYQYIAIYENDNLLVQKDSLMGILNPNMEWVVPLNYDKLYYLYEEEIEKKYISISMEETPYLYTIKQGKKGIIDSLYQIIIPCEYDNINEELTNEVWIVQNKEKYGLIDKYGKTVVNCQYSNFIYDAINQTFIATDSQSRKGILDNKGNIIQTFKYKILEAVAKDYYIVRIDTYQITKREIITESAIVSDKAINIGTCKQVEDTAMYIKEFSYNYCLLNIQTQTLSMAYDDLSIEEVNQKILIIAEKNDKQGILTEIGEIALPFIYDNIEAGNNTNRKKMYHYFILFKNDLYGIANNKGKQIISCKYDKITDSYLEKYVYLHKNNQEFLANTETGFVSNKGYDIIYQNLEQDSVYKNYFFVKYKKKEGIINTLGKEIIPCKYDHIYNIGYTFFSLRIQDKYALANGQGKQITDFIYESIESIEVNNYIVCTQNNQAGLIDSTGKVIIPFSYEKIEIITDEQGQLNYIVGEKEGEMYYFNAIGNKISFPMEENKLYFQKGKGYGYTDKEGKTIIPFNYKIFYDDFADTFDEFVDTFDEKGLIILIKPNKTGIIDTNNQIILPLIYDKIEKDWTYITTCLPFWFSLSR